MGDHAAELLAAERLHEPGGHGDRGVLRIPAGGERVRLRVVHQEHPRHRQSGPSGERGHEVHQIGRGARIDLMGAVHRQHHPIRIPVGEEVGRRRDQQRDGGAAGAADQIADAHEQGRETGQQDRRSEVVHRHLPDAAGRHRGTFNQVVIVRAAIQGRPVRRHVALRRVSQCHTSGAKELGQGRLAHPRALSWPMMAQPVRAGDVVFEACFVLTVG